jgi:hypothetical protein
MIASSAFGQLRQERELLVGRRSMDRSGTVFAMAGSAESSCLQRRAVSVDRVY